MDGLGQAFQSFFSNPGDVKMLQTGMAGAGEVGNLLEERKRLAYQSFVMNLLSHPEKLAQMAAKITQPLDNGLVQATNNRVQGDMASRGLSQAPGIFAASESQALAPYVQQNQNTALQTVMQSLGLPSGSFAPPTSMAPLFSMLFNKPSGTPAQTPITPGLTPPPPQMPTDTGDPGIGPM